MNDGNLTLSKLLVIVVFVFHCPTQASSGGLGLIRQT